MIVSASSTYRLHVGIESVVGRAYIVSRLQPTATDPGSGLCALSGVVLTRVFFSWKLFLVYLSEDSFDGLKQSFSDFKAITVKTHQSDQLSYQHAKQYKCIRLSLECTPLTHKQLLPSAVHTHLTRKTH